MGTYKIKGQRFVRQYKAEELTPAYAAAVDAARVVDEMCEQEWTEAEASTSTMPTHAGNTGTDQANVDGRDAFDAYEFCAEHANGVHRAYAGAACYRFKLPDSAVGVSLTSIACTVIGDPYCAGGVRLSVNTNASGVIPMDCATCRNGASSDTSASAQSNNATSTSPATEWMSTNTHIEGAAARVTVVGANGQATWYGGGGTATISPTGGLVLGKYLYLFVILENYAYSRQGYLEGSACILPTVTITTATDIDMSDTGTVDLGAGTIYYSGLNLETNAVSPLIPMTGTKVDSVCVSPNLDTRPDATGETVILAVVGDVEPSWSYLPRVALYDLTRGRRLVLDGVSRYDGDVIGRMEAALAKNGDVTSAAFCLPISTPSTGNEWVGVLLDLGFKNGPLYEASASAVLSKFPFAFSYYPATGQATSVNFMYDNAVVPTLRADLGRVGAAPAVYTSGGSLAFTVNAGAVSVGVAGEVTWAEALPFNHRLQGSYKVAGTFDSLCGVACNGLAVVTCKGYASGPRFDDITVTRAYPYDLTFDTRTNLKFAQGADGSLYVFGDFSTINGVHVERAARILDPSPLYDRYGNSGVLDPANIDWSVLITPLDMALPEGVLLADVGCVGPEYYSDSTYANLNPTAHDQFTAYPVSAKCSVLAGTIYGVMGV